MNDTDRKHLPNALQPTPVGRLSSAFAVDILHPAWLSSLGVIHTFMKITHLIPVLAVALLTSCSPATHDATSSTPQKLASESATALNAKDYAKAQTLARQATSIDPQFAEAWVGYGMASVRLGQTDHARDAYERALSLHQARHLQNPSDANQVVQQIFLLTLLGRPTEAETLLKQAHIDYSSDQTITKLAEDFTATKQGWQSWMVEVKP
jgi:tetratricopeptide (TPR) repeat protein